MNDANFRPPKIEEFETLLTVEEVADALRVAPVTVRRIIAKSEIETVRVGERHIRVAPSALKAYLADQTRQPARVESAPPAPKRVKAAPVQVFEGTVGKNLPWKVIQADALQGLKSLESETVDCMVTSPPYYWQRDYGYDGQIGHEATITIEGFVEALRDVFSEARRVLKPTGTLFLNIVSIRGAPP